LFAQRLYLLEASSTTGFFFFLMVDQGLHLRGNYSSVLSMLKHIDSPIFTGPQAPIKLDFPYFSHIILVNDWAD
jgi:hypothetical protein